MFTQEELLALEPSNIPHHVAIIPDGNRRWARNQEVTSQKGHQEGADILMDTLRAAKYIGVNSITFYTFSTENWSRSQSEVEGLMWLIESYLENELETMLKEGVSFHTIGDIDLLPQSLKDRIAYTKSATKDQNSINLTLALNYGSRDEIIRACKKMASRVASNEINLDDIDEKMFIKSLDTHFLKDPDLLIRTSGECRLSNFLLWQLSYAEVYITPVLWPDFTPRHLLEAVQAFQKRDRRRGGDHE